MQGRQHPQRNPRAACLIRVAQSKQRIALFASGVLGASLFKALKNRNDCDIIAASQYLRVANDRERYLIDHLLENQWQKELLKNDSIQYCNQFRSLNSQSVIQQLKTLNLDWILLASWPEIISEKTLAEFQSKILNLHPSLLPKHKGSNSYYSVIWHGEKMTGFTLHQVTTEIDSGPILFQSKPILVDEMETGKSLQAKLAKLVPIYMDEMLEKLNHPVFTNQEKTENEKTENHYLKLPTQQQLKADFNLPVDVFCRRTRAVYPWGAIWHAYKGFCLHLGPANFKLLTTLSYTSNPQHTQILFYNPIKGLKMAYHHADVVYEIHFKEVTIKGYPQWVFPLILWFRLRQGKTLAGG